MGISPLDALPLSIAAGGLVFWAWCLRDLVRTDERDVRMFQKRVWPVIVALGSVVGAIVWWAVGRPRA